MPEYFVYSNAMPAKRKKKKKTEKEKEKKLRNLSPEAAVEYVVRRAAEVVGLVLKGSWSAI